MSEPYIFESRYGRIEISRSIIGRIILDIIGEFDGKVFVSNSRGKPVYRGQRKMTMEDVSSIEIGTGKSGMMLKIPIAIKFGTSIGMVTNKIIDRVYEEIKNVVGEAPESVAVVVSGIISKNIARRNIEVKKEYEN